MINASRTSFVILALLIFGAAWGHACECAGVKPAPAAALEEAGAVFLGKVTEIARTKESAIVTLEVDRVWKGVKVKTVRVWAGNGFNCGFHFAVGKKYLVYAVVGPPTAEDKAPFYTSSCHRTCHLGDAHEDLKVIGAGTPIEDAK